MKYTLTQIWSQITITYIFKYKPAPEINRFIDATVDTNNMFRKKNSLQT